LHFKKISEETNVPIIIYNVPTRVGYDLNIKTIEKLSKIKGIIGIKESSTDVTKISEIIKNTKLEIYSGDDCTSFISKILGAKGIISVTANVFPRIVKNIFKKNNKNEIIKNYKKFFYFNKLLFSETNPSPIKWLMYKRKMIKNNLRYPLKKLKNFKFEIMNEFKKLKNEENVFYKKKEED